MRNSQRAVAALLGGIVVLLIVAAILVRIVAPQVPRLSGERATRTYDTADFTGVSISGQWQVALERGNTWGVALDVPVELVDEVRVERNGSVLEVGSEGAWWFGGFRRNEPDLKATITMPALESIVLAGASTLSFSGFEGDRLSLVSSGASEIEAASGRFETLTLVMSGAGNVDLGGLPVTNADIEVSGAGNLDLNMAGGRLTGSMSGAGNLDYTGTVSEQSVSSSGVVSIQRRD